MRRQLFAPLGVLAAAIGIVSMAPVPVAGQSQKAPAKASGAFKTPWGAPDLQGLWSNATITPLERPKELAGKQELSEEEAIAQENISAERRVDRPPRPGDPGTYNQVWMDSGTKVVGSRRTSLIVDPPDGRIPWTPEMQKTLATRGEMRRAMLDGKIPFNSWRDADMGERCITDGIPWVPYAYNNNYLILQTPEHLTILHEQFQERRIIPLDGRPHVNQNVRQLFGDSRGRWEGNTLVVDTTNFVDRSNEWWAQLWRAARPTMHLTERFTRVDAETIEYQFTIEDPTTFIKPWTASMPMTSDTAANGATGGALYEYACHEGNYAMSDILLGSRNQEKTAAGAAKH